MVNRKHGQRGNSIKNSIITHEDSSIVHVTFDRTTYIDCIKKKDTIFN